MVTFKGFSTVDSDKSRDFNLYDIELIKRDLLNHFHTKKGERVLRPEFGSIIWDYLFDPLTPQVVGVITDDVRRICESDSRVSVDDIRITQPQEHGLYIEVDLTYIPFAASETFVMTFNDKERNQQ